MYVIFSFFSFVNIFFQQTRYMRISVTQIKIRKSISFQIFHFLLMKPDKRRLTDFNVSLAVEWPQLTLRWMLGEFCGN